MRISKTLLDKIEAEAKEAFPKEACGLLVGKPGGDEILDAVPSPNLAGKGDEFLIDPALHLNLQRDLRGKGFAILGVYHSHPSGESTPSRADRAGERNPGFYWLITALDPNNVPETAFFVEKTNSKGASSRNFDKVFLQILKNSV